MPTHRAFFPEEPSLNKSVNQTITIPKHKEEGPLKIKGGDLNKHLVENINTNKTLSTASHLPVDSAPLTTIKAKKDSFFLLY